MNIKLNIRIARTRYVIYTVSNVGGFFPGGKAGTRRYRYLSSATLEGNKVLERFEAVDRRRRRKKKKEIRWLFVTSNPGC